MLTQLPRVPSLIPSSFATRAIGRDVSITIFTASSLNSGEKLFFGRDNYLTFPDIHPIGWTVRKLRGTPQLNTRELRNSGLHEALTWDFGLFWRWRGLLVRVWVSSPSLFQEPLVLSYLPDVAVASRTPGFADAGTLVVRAAGLRVRGGGVIEAIPAAALEKGRLRKRQRRRIMSYPLVIRLMIAMTLMPDGSYCESLARLAGLLADVPFALEWHVPTEKVVTDWRLLVPAEVMESVFWEAAGPLIADGEPSAVLLAGMTVCAADGMLVNLADTPANRAMFGCTGTAEQDGEGAAPFPHLRVVALTARAGRAMLGAVLGSTRAGEQTLLRRLARRRPDLFAGRVICFDRNFPGHELITAILDAGGHVVARVKAGISLPMADDGGWLPDGSRLTWLNAPSGKKEDRLPVRAAEHNAVLPCGDGKEVSETWAWLTATQLVRASAAAALRTEAAAARALRREDSAPVTADEESFTAARHHAIRSMTSSQVTASSSLEALAAAADAAARAALHTLNVPGRQRHSKRAQKARPKFPHTSATKTTITGKPQVTVFAPGFC